MGKLKDNEVKQFEKSRYLGDWNEIASFPAWFEKDCSETQAHYSDKGSFIEVKNTCKKKVCDDNVCKIIQNEKIGKAFLTDQPNLLKVQFFAPFKANYKVEFVDKDYQHAIVGSGKNYLWFLTREKTIPNPIFDEMKDIAKEKGYDISKLRIQPKY